MNSMSKNWETLFLGVVEENTKMYENNTNSSMKFSITIKSMPPEDFPASIKTVNGYSDDLEKSAGFVDRKDISEWERIKTLTDFLKDYLLIFKVKEEKHREHDITYYNAYDIELIKKETATTSSTYLPIPLIKVYKENRDDYLKKLSNNEFIEQIEGISYHKDDTPSFILVEEKEEKIPFGPYSSNENSKYYAVGPIEEVIFSEEYGYKFYTTNNKKYIELKREDVNEIYFTSGSISFVPGTNEYEDMIIENINENGKRITPLKSKIKLEDQDEDKFLMVFKEVALSKGLSYNMEDLINFHTAMKTQSFVILAGMSGTGKSRIVQCYHEALNKYAGGNKYNAQSNRSKLLFVPVRPFWQDDTDLLGYLDTLNGIYRPGETGLVDFIYESQRNPEECYIICLDEMNLARVEHYFSQFLSILEREPSKRVISLYNEKLNGRIYNQNDYPAQLMLGENIFFVGTINIDESTFQFSDKVLDRANVINLKLNSFKNIRKELRNGVKSEKESVKSVYEEPPLDNLRTFIKFKGMKKEGRERMLSEKELELLWEIHTQINNVNSKLGVGYRIVNQIEAYLMNIPSESKLTREKSFDLQINQRIFTKLRGSDIQLNHLVGKIEESQYVPGTLYKLLEENKSLSNFENSKKRLQNLAQELTEYGYAF